MLLAHKKTSGVRPQGLEAKFLLIIFDNYLGEGARRRIQGGYQVP